MTTQAAALVQARTRALAKTASKSAAEQWRSVDPDRIADSWVDRLPRVLAVLAIAQGSAARLAGPYVGSIARPEGGLVNPDAFVGVASDGRPLQSLLFRPVVTALGALAGGASPLGALAGGLAVLNMIVRTQVADAGRLATGVAIAATPEITGHERVVHTPACKRCIGLAGRLYRWSDGFKRHPRCDCTMEPVTSDQWRTRNLDNHPRALFDRMSEAQQNKQFGEADAKAIRDGADMSQVINAGQGMTTASVGGRTVQTTTTGTTRRAIAGQRLEARFGSAVVSEFTRNRRTGGTEQVRLRGSRAPRLTPEEIYRITAGDRDHAIRLLTLHGYLL